MKQLENRISSREVAEMMEVTHSKLIRKIDGINDDFREAKIGFSKYWIESTYKVEGQSREYKEFLITKLGCEFLANKTTGTKGNIFTAKYMDRFEEMKEYITQEQYKVNKPTCMEDVMIFSLQEMKTLRLEMERAKNEVEKAKGEIEELGNEIDDIKKQNDAVIELINISPDNWRKDTTKIINSIANKIGGFEYIKDVRNESYETLNEDYKVDVERRLKNKKKNMELAGCCKTKINNVNILDVIEEDKKLIQGYINVVSRMAIKYGVHKVNSNEVRVAQ